MECPVCKHRWSPSRTRNEFDTKIGRSSSTNPVIDSATNTSATAQPPPVNSDNSHPSSSPRISNTSGPQYKSVTTLSAALEALQSQIDHQSVDNDDAEEDEYYENAIETYSSPEEEEGRYEYLDDHVDEDPEDDYEEIPGEDEDDEDDWEEYVD